MKKILILGGNSDIGIQLLKKLINTNNFFTAEKLAKKLYSKNPQRLNYLVDVIISLKKQEKSNKFTFNLKKLFRKLNGRNSQAIQLANRFLSFEMTINYI